MIGRSVRFALAVAAIVAAAFSAIAATAGDRTGGRLLYEMVVTNPGTRSQGWQGTLFSPDGTALVAAPDTVIETTAGAFRMHACVLLWQPCGFIREGSLAAAGSGSLAALTDPLAWAFKLHVIAEGSRSEGWRGELWHGTERIDPSSTGPVETAMGRFLPLAPSDLLWSWTGWQPESWLATDAPQ